MRQDGLFGAQRSPDQHVDLLPDARATPTGTLEDALEAIVRARDLGNPITKPEVFSGTSVGSRTRLPVRNGAPIPGSDVSRSPDNGEHLSDCGRSHLRR